jgi:predicted small metal-binding protein
MFPYWEEMTLNIQLRKKNMKTMTCKQLGGACEKEFHANSFEEIAELSKQHGMEMFQKKDEAHLKAMNEMQELMQKPEAMKDWFENKKKEFETLPED